MSEEALQGVYALNGIEGKITWVSPGALNWKCDAAFQDWSCVRSAPRTYDCLNTGLGDLQFVFSEDGRVASCGNSQQHSTGTAFPWARQGDVPTPAPVSPAPAPSRPNPSQPVAPGVVHEPSTRESFSHFQPSWDPTVPVAPTCSEHRSMWKGVFTDVDEEFLSGRSVVNGNLFVHASAPLVPGLGSFAEPGSDPESIPDGLKQVLEHMNLFMLLMGHPPSRWGGVGLIDGNHMVYSTAFTHFNYSLQFIGNMGQVAHAQEFMGCGFPQTLKGFRMPLKADRTALLDEPAFLVQFKQIYEAQNKTVEETAALLAPFCYGHINAAPYVSAISPPMALGTSIDLGEQEQEWLPCKDARIYVYPPPGLSYLMTLFAGECAGSRNGLPGHNRLVKQCSESYGSFVGSTMGGPIVKFGFRNRSEFSNFQELLHAELKEVGSGKEVPCWVLDPKDGKKYRGKAWRDEAGNTPQKGEEALPGMREVLDTGAAVYASQQCALVPKPILTQNMQYQVDVLMAMKGEPNLEVSWTFQVFGPRVYMVQADGKADETINFALETIHFTSWACKPCMQNGQPVPNHIMLGPGEHVIEFRGTRPGAWLIIQGHPEGSTIVLQTNPDPPRFEMPQAAKQVLGDSGDYEWESDKPSDPHVGPFAFDLSLLPYATHQHGDYGVGDETEIFLMPAPLVTLKDLTLKHNGTIALAREFDLRALHGLPGSSGQHGRIELVNCVNAGPAFMPEGPIVVI